MKKSWNIKITWNKSTVCHIVGAVLVAGAAVLFYRNHGALVRTRQQLAQVQLQLQALQARRPPMPVTMGVKADKFKTGGYDVLFRSISNRELQVLATFINPTTQARKALTIELSPYGANQVGYAQGWAFHSGDRIYLQHADYANEDSVVPVIGHKLKPAEIVGLSAIAIKASRNAAPLLR